MEKQFQIIKQARALLAKVPKSAVRKNTVRDYLGKVERLRKRGNTHGGMYDGAIAEALKTTKKSSWQASRAALRFAARLGLETYLANQDRMQLALKAMQAAGHPGDWTAWHEMVERVEEARQALQAILDAKLPAEGRTDRHTKRQDMRGLPDDWRERLIARMPNYAPAALVAAVTGCRPSELVLGVRLTIEGGMLVAHITGAKVDLARGKGQEWRRMYWPTGSQNNLVRDLIDATAAAGGVLEAKISSAGNFSAAMASAAAREWPARKASITPYCMRHAAAADMKATDGMSDADVSAALGHASNVTKSTYGRVGSGRSGGVAPVRVESAVKVASPKKVTAKSRAMTRKIKKTPGAAPVP